MTLHRIDYAVVLIPFTVVLLVSWHTRRYMKSVADFMSASRCGGRYLLATAAGEAGLGAVSVVAFSNTPIRLDSPLVGGNSWA